MKHNTLKLTALALPVLLLLSACTPPTGNTLTNTLEIITASAEVALDITSATGAVDPSTLQLVTTYIHAVSTATSAAATELATGHTDTQKAAAIISAFQSAVVPVLSPSVNPRVVAIINAVAAGVKVLLAHFEQMNAIVTAGQSKTASRSLPTVANITLPKTTAGDKAKLKSLSKRAASVSAKTK